MAALLLFLLLVPVAPAGSSPYCLPVQPGSSVASCYAPSDTRAQGLLAGQVDPAGVVHRLTGMRLKQIITFKTESANGGHPDVYLVEYVFGGGLRRTGTLVTVPAAKPHFVLVSELLAHAQGRRVSHDIGGLRLFRVASTATSVMPWTATSPLDSGKLTLEVTTNLSRSMALHLAKAIAKG